MKKVSAHGETTFESLPTRGSLWRLWRQVDAARRWRLLLLLSFMIVGALLEVLVLGAVVPFMAIIISPASDKTMQSGRFETIEALTVGLPWFPSTATGWAVVLAVVIGFSSVFRVLLSKEVLRFAFGLGHDLSVRIYRNALHQPYLAHVQSNSSRLLSAIDKCNAAIFNVVLPLLNMAVATVISFAIVLGLFLIDAATALFAAIFFSAVYALVLQTTRKRLAADSRSIAEVQTARIKSVQEGVGGMRDILLEGLQPVFVDIFSVQDSKLRTAQVSTTFLGNAPRYVVESVGMILIVGLALWGSLNADNAFASIPVLSAMALGAQRLLPQMQQIYYGWSSFRGQHASLVEVVEHLEQAIPSEFTMQASVLPLSFARSVSMRSVSFKYPDAPDEVLRNIHISIPRGSMVGIVGTTGGGKSTLVDILMGLLPPTDGEVLVDGAPLDQLGRLRWRKSIAHVPQHIYLSDSTVAENIAFGVPKNEIDIDRVRWAASRAHISDLIESLPGQYSELVGERGARLSGGQRQRIGIARALYKKPELLILDEATSALDMKTESLVIESLMRLGTGLTTVMVAHRVSTLHCCDAIYEVRDQGCFRVEMGAAGA